MSLICRAMTRLRWMINHDWIENAVGCLWLRSEQEVCDDDGYPTGSHVIDQDGWDAAMILWHTDY